MPETQKSPTNGSFSTTMYIANTVHISPETQDWFVVTTKQHGVNVAQLLPSFPEQQQVACAKGVVSIQPNVLLKALITKLGRAPHYLLKGQVIGFVFSYPTELVYSRIPIEQVLGIMDYDESEKPPNGDVSEESTPPS